MCVPEFPPRIYRVHPHFLLYELFVQLHEEEFFQPPILEIGVKIENCVHAFLFQFGGAFLVFVVVERRK